ncbi:sulfotransferase [Microlunatus sp. Gsoil 973]|uniref:sulfotransferase n=1 Tax=Microlunatus sp. Gsoil 973 TaxID=2672569 RepID=UPI0012B4CC61|nr:sulfotransferase [Microlunatus sp. Gsoil 973]QGN32795.1 hypothetical protein GJV80_08220 [Microlunatus sp. Gsoil 973]
MRYLAHSDGFEDFLAQLNRVSQSIPEPALSATPASTVQIVGLPRSGTTVLYQLLARTGAVGYPSNLMAFFHRAPWVGAVLQQRLTGSDPTISLSSLAGRTPEPLDPHEFGYFWRRACGHSTNSLDQDLNPLRPADLQHDLDLVADVFGRPVVYKNFLALAHAPAMRRDLKRMLFISVERDPLDAAVSLLALRSRLGVPDDQVFGTAPALFCPDPRDPITTVARQIALLTRQQATCGFAVNSDSIVIRYTDLVDQPRRVISDLMDFLQCTTNRLNAVIPEKLPSGAGASRLPGDVPERLRKSIERTERELSHDGSEDAATERTS